MSFLKMSWLPFLVIGIILVIILVIWHERKFFQWVKEHWFYSRSKKSILSTFFVLAGLSCLSIILLDPRGESVKIRGTVKQSKTILLIDTSTSMMAEDVKPNRLEKAILIAKHFSRKSPGHKISVMIFADITKKLVPFTDDRDLLDARLDSIKEIRNLAAGSSIGMAIKEAVQYFGATQEGVYGNILVITDGEDSDSKFELDLPDKVSLVMVGVGTKSGGVIPIRDQYGFYHGNKKYRGETVTSKLDEGFFQRIEKENKRVKYYISQSYDLPTDEIMAFFEQQKNDEKEGDNIVRAVLMDRFAIPGLVLLMVGLGLKFFKPFVLMILLLPFCGYSQDEPKELTPEIGQKLSLLKEGKLSLNEKLRLADDLARNKAHPMAQQIYQETLTTKEIRNNNKAATFNWGTSLLESKKLEQGMSVYGALLKELEKSSEAADIKLKQKLEENLKKILSSSGSGKDDKNNKDKDQKDQSKDQNKSDSQQSDSKSSSGDGKDQKEKPKSGEDKENKENPFDPKNQEKENEKKDKEKKSQDSQETDKEDKEKPGNEKKSESESAGEQKSEKRKLSPVFQQLKDDDRKLQMKLLDTSTQKREGKGRKDW